MSKANLSRPAVVRKMRDRLNEMNSREEYTPCAYDPVLYTEMRQSAESAWMLCRDCPIRELCEQLGSVEGVAASGMVYGGRVWRRDGAVMPPKRSDIPKPPPGIKRSDSNAHH